MKRAHTFSALGCLLGAVWFGCSQEDGLAPSPVGDEVMRDGPIDRAAVLEGRRSARVRDIRRLSTAHRQVRVFAL